MLEQYLSQIRPADRRAYAECGRRWDALAKPLGSLGRLEEAVRRLAAIQGCADVSLNNRAVVVFCADNGVVAQGVSQSGPEVTATVAREMAAGRGNINALARCVQADVFPWDVGMAVDEPEVPQHKTAAGTADITRGPAMSREQAEELICFGIELAGRLKERRYDVIVGGEMGIGNTTTSAAIAALLLACDPGHLVGRGAGLSDGGMQRKLQAIRTACEVNRPLPDDPLDVLCKLGGFDIAALCGLFLGGAVHRIAIVIDGVIAAVAALLASQLHPACRDYMLASHVSREPADRLILEKLGLAPVICGELALGEGSGGVLLLPLLDGALSVYDQGSTFDSFGMAAYTPQEGKA